METHEEYGKLQGIYKAWNVKCIKIQLDNIDCLCRLLLGVLL